MASGTEPEALAPHGDLRRDYMSQWTLFSNHGHVLVVLSRDPDARLRDVAQVVGITERAVQKIVRDLQDGGMLSIEKQGRRNRYHLHGNVSLRHALEAHCTTGELLALINRALPGGPALEMTQSEPSPESRPEAQTPAAVEAESVPAPGIEPESEPEPEPESVSEPEAAPVSSKKRKPRKRRKAPKDDKPVDQGSLF